MFTSQNISARTFFGNFIRDKGGREGKASAKGKKHPGIYIQTRKFYELKYKCPDVFCPILKKLKKWQEDKTSGSVHLTSHKSRVKLYLPGVFDRWQ